MEKYDTIIIGSGQGGTPLSKKLANAGYKTALVEKRWIGGTCINDGCTPTKAMIASAKLAFAARNGKTLGIQTGDVSVDLKTIIKRKNDIVTSFREGSKKGLEKTDNLELIFGEARFTGLKKLEVTLHDGSLVELSADVIFINTGATPAIPPIEGLETIPYLTSTTILDLEEIPKHLFIVGGGYVSVEFGQMFSRFGSVVTIVEKSKDFLSIEDRDIAECMTSILTAEGIKIYTNASAKKFTKTEKGISVTISVGDKDQEINASHVLMAVGRTPQTKQLDLDKTGVKTNEKGFIEVNDQLETSQPGIYALGDVKGGPAFTHISYNDHLVVFKNITEKAGLSIKDRQVPYCMFTNPQLGRVGMTETEARKKGLNIQVATLSMQNVARAIETGHTSGMMKAVIDKETKQILGVAIIGEEGGETMSVLQVAMMGKLTYEQLRDNVFAHPLYAESINNLFLKVGK